MQHNDFHITIGSHPTGELSLEHDLRLVKASLLYADKSKLCSFTSSLLLTILSYGLLDTKQRNDFIESMMWETAKHQDNLENNLKNLELYKILKQKKNLDRTELYNKIMIDYQVKKTSDAIEENFSKMLEKAGIKGLLQAIESGLLEIQPLNITDNENKEFSVKHFVEVLSQTILDQNTYPLFDDKVGNLVRLAVKEGKMEVSEYGIARGKHCGLAANLLERLPLFECAEITEILDIRKELDRPLKRFRGAMIKFSAEIKNAAWDKDFSQDAENIFRRDIEPSISDIEDAVNNNKYLSNLTRKIGEKQILSASSVLGAILSPLSELPTLITTLGVGIPAGIVAKVAFDEWKEKNKEIEKNSLFFYYKAKVKFSN